MSGPAFGTDGIRGTAGVFPVTAEVGRAVGRAAARLAQERGDPRVVVIRDPRPSGRALADAVLAGAAEAGATALDGGVAPTAAAQVAVASGLAATGVVITASHNPEADNGFKILVAGGRKPDDETCRTVERWLAGPPAAGDGGSVVDAADAVLETWWRSVVRAVPDPSPLHGRHLVIDLANGAATVARERLAAWLPARLTFLGTGGEVNAGCGSEHLDAACAAVGSAGADAGLAVDGDADRCRLIDEAGRPVDGDAVTFLLARSAGVDALAVTVMSNGALEAHLPGVVITRTPVGDRHLRAVMDARGVPLGAEESGHVLFADHPAGDGLVAGLRALCAAFSAASTVSGALDGFSLLPRRLLKVRVAARPALDRVPELEAERVAGEARLGAHGRVFLRYSGTEPVLRILVEGADPAVVDAVARGVAATAERVIR